VPAKYTMQARKAAYKSQVREDLNLTAEQTVTANFLLDPIAAGTLQAGTEEGSRARSAGSTQREEAQGSRGLVQPQPV